MDVSRDSGKLTNEALALIQRGHLLRIRGDWSGAEEMYKKALEINKKLGRLEGVAYQYVNLGNILLNRGNLDGAEEIFKKALDIAKLEGFKHIESFVKELLIDIKKIKNR